MGTHNTNSISASGFKSFPAGFQIPIPNNTGIKANLKRQKSGDPIKSIKSPVRGFKSSKDLLGPLDLFGNAKYVTKEYQDYGYRLALNLNDLKHKSLYMKLAKVEKRILIEKALRFASDYPKAKNKASIFMWKLKELRTESKTPEVKTAKMPL